MGNSVNTNRMNYRTNDPLSHENFRNAKRASLSTKTSIRGKVDAIGPTTIAQTVTMPRVQPKYGKFSNLGRNKIGHYFRMRLAYQQLTGMKHCFEYSKIPNQYTVEPACMVHGCKVNPLVRPIFGRS